METWPISRLHEHPLHDLHFPLQPAEELEALLDSLKAYGQREPLEILPDGTVVSGRHRLIAAKQLGWEQLEVRVRHDLASAGEAQIELFLIDCNCSRRQLSGLARARLYLRCSQLEDRGTARRGRGELRDELAKRFGMSGRNLDRYVKLLAQPRELQDAVECGKLALTDALKLSELTHVQQRKVLDLLGGNGPDLVEARRLVRSKKRIHPKASSADTNALKRLLSAGMAVQRQFASLSRSISKKETERIQDLAVTLVRLVKSQNTRSG